MTDQDWDVEGWDVVTSDDDKVGRVVAVTSEYLIVEQGLLIKSRHAVPKQFATPRSDGRSVCVTVPKDLVSDSPKVDSAGHMEEQAVAEHYGLTTPGEAAPTEGYGDIVSDADPAWTAESDAAAAGLQPAEQERAEIRSGGERLPEPSSPALLGNRNPDA